MTVRNKELETNQINTSIPFYLFLWSLIIRSKLVFGLMIFFFTRTGRKIFIFASPWVLLKWRRGHTAELFGLVLLYPPKSSVHDSNKILDDIEHQNKTGRGFIFCCDKFVNHNLDKNDGRVRKNYCMSQHLFLFPFAIGGLCFLPHERTANHL